MPKQLRDKVSTPFTYEPNGRFTHCSSAVKGTMPSSAADENCHPGIVLRQCRQPARYRSSNSVNTTGRKGRTPAHQYDVTMLKPWPIVLILPFLVAFLAPDFRRFSEPSCAVPGNDAVNGHVHGANHLVILKFTIHPWGRLGPMCALCPFLFFFDVFFV